MSVEKQDMLKEDLRKEKNFQKQQSEFYIFSNIYIYNIYILRF